jgi:pimeloyl-ACP methyl ester carboxylesterase
MLYGAKELKLTANGMQFDYIRFGSGKRALIMIQGLNTRGIKGAALSLAYMYRIFAKEYTVYLFDRRPVVYDGITVRDMAADIASAMDALGLKNADVFGTSQGGMIAQYLAIDRPDLVRRLVLAVTLSRNNDTVKQVVGDWIEMAERGDMKRFVLDMAEKMYSETYVKKYRPLMPLLTILQKPKDVKRFVILAKSCLTCDTYDILDKIKCPTLVIGGKQDKVVSGVASEEIAEKLGCALHMYENLGHAAYEEAQDFNQMVYDFLSE